MKNGARPSVLATGHPPSRSLAVQVCSHMLVSVIATWLLLGCEASWLHNSLRVRVSLVLRTGYRCVFESRMALLRLTQDFKHPFPSVVQCSIVKLFRPSQKRPETPVSPALGEFPTILMSIHQHRDGRTIAVLLKRLLGELAHVEMILSSFS